MRYFSRYEAPNGSYSIRECATRSAAVGHARFGKNTLANGLGRAFVDIYLDNDWIAVAQPVMTEEID